MIHSMKNGVLGSCANELKFTLIYLYIFLINFFFLLRIVSSFLQVQYVILSLLSRPDLAALIPITTYVLQLILEDLKNKALLNARKRG